MDTYSDEGPVQIEHDQTRPELNWALSDFDRTHRLIMSWAWELPFRGSRLAERLADLRGRHVPVGPSVHDDRRRFQRFPLRVQEPRPSLAPGMTLDDQTTAGSVNSRLDAYLNRDAFASSGSAVRHSADETRSSVPASGGSTSACRRSRGCAGRASVELRLEAYNVTNTPSFRNPVSDLGAANFGQITRTRGGPRLLQLGVKLRF